MTSPLRALAFLLAFNLIGSLPSANAENSPDRQFYVGATTGQVGLLGTVGDKDPNSIGYGFAGGYRFRPNMILEFGYLTSGHTDLRHRDVSIGVAYYLGSYEAAYAHVSGGASFLKNELNNPDISGDAFGLYAGAGLDFELTNEVTAGLEARYQKAFEASATVNNSEVKTVQDSYTVLLRVLYHFNDFFSED